MIIRNNKSGYIALFSTIILTAVFLLLFVGMFLLSTGGMTRIANQENAFLAESWANTCAEEALNQIRNNPNTNVNIILHGTSNNGCQISDGSRYGGNFFSFESTGVFSEHTKTVRVDLKITETLVERRIEVFDWIEVKN